MALSKDRLELLIDRSTDIVVATDRKGTVVYYNDGAQRGLGYDQEEIVGNFVGRLYPDIDEAKRVMTAMRGPQSGGAGVVETFPTTFLTKDGAKIPVAISGTLIYDDQGAEDGSIGFAKDLRQILHKEELATLGEVAIGLSHEINNPLAVIINQIALLEGELERLAGDRDTSVEQERLDAVRREVARITEIIERLGEIVRSDTYETIEYIGPAKMIDLRRREKPKRFDDRLAGLRILVADDDNGICQTMKEILEGSGCDVTTAADGAEALRSIATSTFHLVLTDVVMPNMDGYELYLAVKKTHPELPILMMTAFHYDKDHIIKRSRIEGLEGVIFKKPVDPDRLRQVIAETLGRAFTPN
jgi:PAS domain S-box-containing protein